MRVFGGVDLVVAQEVTVGVGWWPWWGGEGALVGDAGDDGLLHRVVDFEDRLFGAIAAVILLFVAVLEYGKGIHDVISVGVRDTVEMEKGGVEFGSDLGAAGWVPAESWTVVVEIAGETGEVVCGIDQF